MWSLPTSRRRDQLPHNGVNVNDWYCNLFHCLGSTAHCGCKHHITPKLDQSFISFPGGDIDLYKICKGPQIETFIIAN